MKANTTRILGALGFDGARLSLTVCGDAKIRTLNRLHRGLDRATDVLAFPQEHMREGRFLRPSPSARAWLSAQGARHEARDTKANRRLAARASRLMPHAFLELGDVVISRHAVRRQAAAYGVSEAEEWTRLLVHGILHLLGWDHEKPGERVRMRALEDRLVKLITRT
ncbi:MAG: rRNA maturation RNase YbeY [Deltaproteobacteria bacterium]|nr:rRNA maturation RNase YbeY [Deltaproteobacteria bacterium]